MKIKYIILFTILIIGYIILGNIIGFYIPCPIHEIFHVYCPGCGITRMLLSLLKLDFYQAFRYNPLLFILLPFFLFFFINNIIAKLKNKTPLYQKVNKYVWYVLIFVLLLYGVLRNIYPILAPTVIS